MQTSHHDAKENGPVREKSGSDLCHSDCDSEFTPPPSVQWPYQMCTVALSFIYILFVMNIPAKELVHLLGLVHLQPKETLTHRQRVTRLYRHTLKTLDSWAIYRDTWSRAAKKVQGMFRARAAEANPLLVERFCQEGEKWLHEHRHPDPYIVPYRPGGTLYQRNEPLPDYVRSRLPLISSSRSSNSSLFHSFAVPQSTSAPTANGTIRVFGLIFVRGSDTLSASRRL